MLLVTLSPVSTASGVMVGGGESSGVAPKVASVSTAASQNGIRIRLRDVPRNVQSFDVYRSESVLAEGTQVNAVPVTGRTYVDTTAQAGKQYYYTVKLVQRSDAAFRGAYWDVPPVLPQVKADVAKARPSKAYTTQGDSSPAAAKKAAGSAADPQLPAAPAPTAAAVRAMSVTTGTASAVTTLAASQTWTPAGGPYFIRGDVVVPAGKTLTILPGTKVYFDTAASGDLTRTPVPGVQSVTRKIDLIVHGKLVAKGTATNPILFSSINSTVESSSAGAVAADNGDWGCVFVDSADASEVSYARFEYGLFGVWAHRTLRPYVTNCTFSTIGYPTNFSTFPWGAVSFTNPPKGTLTTPRILITGNKISAVEEGEGIDVILKSDGTSGADRVVDPYIANNDIRGSYGIGLIADDSPYGTHAGTFGNTLVKGTITKNRIRAVWDAAYGWADSRGGKSGTWAPAFSGNSMLTTTDDAIWVDQVADGVGADSYVRPTFSGDTIVSDSGNAVFMDVASISSSVPTSVGDAKITPTFTSCQLRSRGDSSVYIRTGAQAAGAAVSDPVFVGGDVQSTGGEGVYALSSSTHGAASASPSFTSLTGRSWAGDYDFLDCEASSVSGAAKASPKWVGGSLISADDDGIYAYARSSKGSAEAKPYVADTQIQTYDYCVDAEAFGAQDDSTASGGANASLTVKNSRLVSTEYNAVYADADTNGTGSAICSPTFTNSDLTAEDYYSTELFAESVGGAATCSPTYTGCSLWGYDGNYAEAVRSGDGTKVADATVSPTFSSTVAVAKYDNALTLDCRNSGLGNAISKPVLNYSDFVSSYWYVGLDLSADVVTTGTAEVAPVALGSTFVGDYGAVYVSTDGPSDGSSGAAKTNGTYTDCSFSSAWDNAVYNYAQSFNGASEVKPTFTRCLAEAPSAYGYEFDCLALGQFGKSATAAPVISGGRVDNSAYGVGVWAYSYEPTGTIAATAAPRLLSVPIVATSDYGIYTWAMTYGHGSATNSSYVYNCPTTSMDGIIHEAITADASAADAVNTAQTMGVSSTRRMPITAYDGAGVTANASAANGSAIIRSQSKYLAISAGTNAITSSAYSAAGTETAVCSPVISGNVNDDAWSANGVAVNLSATANGADASSTVAPSITTNSLVSGGYSDGISLWSDSAKPVTQATISGNSVRAAGNGVYVGSSKVDASSTVTITKNLLPYSRLLGVYIDNIPAGTVSQNRIIDAGWGYSGTMPHWNASGLAWVNPNAAKAFVTGNMIAGARAAGVYYTGGAATTRYNSFGDMTGNLNRPYNWWSEDTATSTVTPYDARSNWWGAADMTSVLKTINTPAYSGTTTEIVNASMPLTSCQAKLTSIGVAKTSTKVTFTLKFDRPMDPAIKTLAFGKSAPYATYKVTGTWYKDAAGNYTTFKGTRSRSGLPTAVKLYFSGAKDLPGSPMLSTSKYFKL